MGKKEVKRVSKQQKAGLVLPVARIGKVVRSNLSHKDHVSMEAMIAVTAAAEYFVQELLELSGNTAIDKKKQQIKPTMIHEAIVGDPMLDRAFANHLIVGGGCRKSKRV